MGQYFEWDAFKNTQNVKKHNVSFNIAKKAFQDKKRLIFEDLTHSKREQRYFCIGKVSRGVITVRFTYRENKIRVFGAGFWRQGKKLYEETNN